MRTYDDGDFPAGGGFRPGATILAGATITIHATAPGTIGAALTNKAVVAANELDVNKKNNSTTQKTTTT